MDNGCLVVRKWQVEPAKIERRRWNRRRTTARQTLTNEGVKTHYQNNSRDLNDIYKKDYKEQMKNRDFRKTLTKTMKNDNGLLGFDRFELQMYRLNLPFTHPSYFIPPIKIDPALIINATVEPEIFIPTITIPKE